MGLMTGEDRFRVLSDIQGMEDFSGDMDFKVAGTEGGITAIQLDCKIRGLTFEMIRATLDQAREGRLHILGRMLEAIREPRAELSPHAPRIITLQINPEKIGAVIGPGGKMIKQIEAETGASISVEQDGTIYVAAVDGEGGERAAQWIRSLTAEVEVGQKYRGRVTRLMGMGAFVEILPGKDGLVHISHLSEEAIRRPEDVVKVGDEIDVRVIEIDSQGRVNLSAIGLDEPFDPSKVKPREDRGRGGRPGGGGRGGDRGDRGGGDRFGDRSRPRDPDRGFRGAPSAEPRDEPDETPKARFRPRR